MEGVNGAVPVAPGVEDKGGPPPPSPLTGCYLLLVVAEPYTPQHKDIILQRIAKGLLSWNVNECLVDLEKELAIVTEQALEGEEARYGERLIQFASENLVTEILIHPVVSTLAQCMRNLLSSFTKHRHIIHAGYTFAANGSWALQDGTFSYTDFAEAFQELEVQRVIRAYENGITIDLHCSPEGDWTKLPKEQFTKACKVRVNPSDVLTSGSLAINNFVNYISPFLIPTSLECLLESSDVVGNIRFSRPTLYVFPGGQGDAALFGINGFNMLLDGGYARKACFWDFVRHLDRLDAVLMTRLNNSNVGGISSVLRRKKQDALYPQIGHFFCNLQERKALLSPDGDKDRDPLLINLLDEGQEIVSNLRHLHLTPQVCYRDSEPINLYHKVGHGTLDMYILSPSKDSKELREFLHKWNQSDPKLFANAKSSREFSFPLQNLVSIAALIVWQPADPDDTITRILFPGSCPQAKIFEGLDRLKSLEFVKSAVCTDKSLSSTTTKKTAIIERIAAKDKEKIIADKKENKIIENNIAEVNVEVKEKTVKKSDSTESDRSMKQKKIEDHKMENGDRSKPKPRPTKPRSESQQRRKPIDKKASPKKVPTENGDIRKPTKPSPVATPAKSAKDASNRKVIESKVKQAPAAATKPSAEPKPKVERKPISRRPKAMKAPISPVKKLVNGIQKPDSISRKGRLDKEGTTDSSTVSTPSVDQESVLKKDISKLTPDELQQLKAQELADLKEEQEAVKEIEAVFRKGEGVKGLGDDENLRKVKDISIDDDKLEEKEEYLIIEKEVIQQDSMDDKEAKEDETQKLARDSEESEKQRKPSVEEQRIEIESQINGIVTEAEDVIKSKDEHVDVSKVTSPEDKADSAEKKVTDKDIDEVKDVVESQPDEKVSVNIKSGDTTTAPTLPEDERIPLDEIKEDNGQAIEEKHVKEDTKEKEVPVIRLPPKPAEIVGKIPSVVGIKLDKQSHIRDIVKTPDEVADLPVHEEADFEYTQDVKAETVKTNEIVEDKKSDDKVKSKEETKMVESEKDSDELAQEKPKEVVPKMKEELKQLTDTVIKTELKTDTLGDKAAEDEEEDQVIKKDKPDKKAEMDSKDTENKIDIVEKQEEEEQEFKKSTTKEKSPETKTTTQDIEKDKTADVEKEIPKADEQKGEHVELSYDVKAESKEQIISKEDKQQDNKKDTELHEPKTEKHDGEHKEIHLETKIQEAGIAEKHELQKSDTTQKTVKSDVGDTQIGKLDVEKPTDNIKSEVQHDDSEKPLEIADEDVKTKLDEKGIKEHFEKDESTKEKTVGRDDLTEQSLKDKTDSEFKHTSQEKEPDKAESDKLKDDVKSKDEKIAKEETSVPSKEKEKTYDSTIAKEETIESKIELELKESEEIICDFTEEPVIDHTKISTEKADKSEVLTKPEQIIKDEVGQDIKDAEKEKDIPQKTEAHKIDSETTAKVEELIKDEKPVQKSHDHEAQEEKEKDIATPIEVKEEKAEPQKEKDIKQEGEHKIEKSAVEKVDVFEKPPDKTPQEVKNHKIDQEPITNIEDLVKDEKKYDGKTDGDHDTKPDQKSHEHGAKEDIKDDEKKGKDKETPFEVKKEKADLQKDEDIKHEDEHKIEKREVGKDIDGSDKTLHEIKDHKMDAEPVTKIEGQTEEKHEDGKTDSDYDTKPDQKSYEPEVKEETREDGKKEKDVPIEVKEEKAEPQKKQDITHEDEHKIEKHETEKDIDVSKKIGESDLPESKHLKQEKSAIVEKQLDTDISKHVHLETKSTGDEKEAVKPPSKLDMEQQEHIGEVMLNGVDAIKDLHSEDLKSTIEDEDSHMDNKHSVSEGKQKEIDEGKDQDIDPQKSIVEDKQKDSDVPKERQKSISEIEKIELGRKSPMDLGRKSPKEREEDVIKIVASVAEVLKSDAPLEEFEGKLPIDTFTSFTSELRETHITTLDSPSAANGEIVKPEVTPTFVEDKEKHETETTNRRSSLLKESQELMIATTKMISDIKTTKTDEKEDDEEVGTVHRMLVTASSEDGGEETEICPPGSIIFSRSSESSGRSSPEHSQKLSQRSSVIDTASESLTTIRPAREQEEKDSGIDDVKSDTELPDQKSAAEKDSGRESPAKKTEDASIKTVSGKSTPDKDASIKSIASGKSTPDISDLEQSKDTDEFRKTEEEMSIEAVETIETEAVAKKDSIEVQHQKQETHVGDESKKVEDTKVITDLGKVKEDVQSGDSHTKEEKEAEHKKEEQKEEKESEYIMDPSPKELDYDASKVQNDKTPERLPSRTPDHLKKEIDEVQDSFIEAVSRDEAPRKSSIPQDGQIKGEVESKIDLDHDQGKEVPRKSSLKMDDILKKEIQEVQESFIDSVAKEAVMVDGIDVDETSPRKMSLTGGRPLQDEIQECESKESKAVDDSVKDVEDNFIESSGMKSKSVSKQTDEFLRKEIEAVQDDSIESVSKDRKLEELKDEDSKTIRKPSLKADESLKEEIKQLQDEFIDALAEDTLKKEGHFEVESRMPVKDEIVEKDVKDVEHVHDKIDVQKQESSLKEDLAKGIHEKAAKSTVDEKNDIAPHKAEQLLKKEIDEVQEEFIESVSKDFEVGTTIKQDTTLQANEQLQHDDKAIKDEQSEEKISFHTLPKAEFPEKVVDPTKVTDAEDHEQEKMTPLRKSSLKASELLKQEIKEVQDGFVESITKDIADETKTVTESAEKIDEKLSLKLNEMKEDVKSDHNVLETDVKEDQGQEKKDSVEIDKVVDAAQKDDTIVTEKIEEGHKESLKKSSKTEEMLKKEIKELQETFIEAVASDIKTSEIVIDPSEPKIDKPLEKVDETVRKEMHDVKSIHTDPDAKHVETARRASLKADELLKEEIKELQEGFIESVSKDLSAEKEETKDDKADTKLSKEEEAEKDELKKESHSDVEPCKKEEEAKKDELKKEPHSDVEPSKKEDEPEKDELKKEPHTDVEPCKKEDEAKKDELKKEPYSDVEPSKKEDEAKKDEFKKESHSDVEPSKKEEEATDTIIDGISTDRKSSLTSNGLIRDTKSHQKQESKDTKAECETDKVIKADEIKKAIQEIQDEFIESVAEDFVLIDRIKKDNTADQTDTEEANKVDKLDGKAKSSPVKESSEKTLEQSCAELADTFNKVADMTKSVMFDKCETSVIDPAVVKKDEEELEERAKETVEAYETVNELAKTISFEKLTDKHHEENGKVSSIADLSKSLVADDTDTSKIDKATLRKDEKMLEKQADNIEDAYDTVSKLVKSITFEKVEENAKTDEVTLKQDEKLLKQKASDIEDAYETVSNLAKSIPFEKVEDTVHIDKETLKKDEKLLEQRADDIEDAYDTVTKLAKDIPFEKVESHSHVGEAPIEHDEKLLEQTAGDVEMAYETVTKLAKRISFDKVEDKSEKDKVSADVSKRSTVQEHEVDGLSQESKENKVESSITGSTQHSEQTVVESKDSEKYVADEKTVEKERKDSISQPRKESLPTSDHGNVDIHTKTTLEVTQSRSEAKKLSISEVEILLTGDKSASDEQPMVVESYQYEEKISGAATPPTVPVSPNIKDASSPEVKYTEYTESDIRFTATEQMDPMCMSFYGSLPEDEKIDEDTKEGEVTHLFEITKAKFSTPMSDPTGSEKGQPGQTEDQPSSSKDKDSSKDLGKPLGLPPPPQPTYLYEITKAKYSTGTKPEEEVLVEEEVESSYVYRETDMMNTSFYGSLPADEDDVDPLRMWGKPLGLPSPAPPNDNKGTPKKERKLPSNVSAKNKLNDDKKRAESPSKHNRNRKNNPIYVDLTYVPHHGNTYYAYVDFFKRIRARYYVFSGIEPSREVYNALLEAKQTWEDKELEVTIIPTYDTDVLGYWVAENEDLLAKYKIDLSPSASRCTINLQDHETSCSAYRLEF